MTLATPQKAAPPAGSSFVLGLRSLLGGFGFLVTTPSVWPLAMVPVAIAALVSALAAWGGLLAVPWLVAKLGGTPASTLGEIGAIVLRVAATLIALAIALLAGLALAQPLSGAALERIVLRVDQKLGAPARAPESFLVSAWRALGSVVVSLAFGVPLLVVLALVSFFFPPAAFVTVPLKVIVLALLVAWDLCDYPLSIRGIPVGERVAFMKRHAAAMLGFGIALGAISALGCTLLFILPAGVAGAAALVVELERRDLAEGRAWRTGR